MGPSYNFLIKRRVEKQLLYHNTYNTIPRDLPTVRYGHLYALLLLLIVGVLARHVLAHPTRHVDAFLFGDAAAGLSRFVPALLSRDVLAGLTRLVPALLPRHVLAVLSRLVPALFSGHSATLLPWLVPAFLPGLVPADAVSVAFPLGNCLALTVLDQGTLPLLADAALPLSDQVALSLLHNVALALGDRLTDLLSCAAALSLSDCCADLFCCLAALTLADRAALLLQLAPRDRHLDLAALRLEPAGALALADRVAYLLWHLAALLHGNALALILLDRGGLRHLDCLTLPLLLLAAPLLIDRGALLPRHGLHHGVEDCAAHALLHRAALLLEGGAGVGHLDRVADVPRLVPALLLGLAATTGGGGSDHRHRYLSAPGVGSGECQHNQNLHGKKLKELNTKMTPFSHKFVHKILYIVLVSFSFLKSLYESQ